RRWESLASAIFGLKRREPAQQDCHRVFSGSSRALASTASWHGSPPNRRLSCSGPRLDHAQAAVGSLEAELVDQACRAARACAAPMMSAPRAPPQIMVVPGPAPKPVRASCICAVTRGTSLGGKRGVRHPGASTMWPLTTTTGGGGVRVDIGGRLWLHRLP